FFVSPSMIRPSRVGYASTLTKCAPARNTGGFAGGRCCAWSASVTPANITARVRFRARVIRVPPNPESLLLHTDGRQALLHRSTGSGRELEEIVVARQPRERDVEDEQLLRRILGHRQLDRQRLLVAIEQPQFAAIERREHRPLDPDVLVPRELEA